MDDYSSRLVGKAHSSSRIAESPLKDPLPMMLHVPSAPHRPGDMPCFAAIRDQPGDLSRPDTLAPHGEMHDHCRINAETCRYCQERCNFLLGEISSSGTAEATNPDESSTLSR